MRTPVRSIPPDVARWSARARWLRWLDAAAAIVAAWPLVASTVDATAAGSLAVTAILVGVGAFIPSVRVRWRPVSALVSLSVSRGLGPGDVAWCVFSDRVERVIVTARRRGRLVVARPGREPAEGLEVRRTRVLVIES
jgi:hypothetical protein